MTKKLLIIAAAVLFLAACGQRTTKTTEENTEELENSSLIVSLDKASFERNVSKLSDDISDFSYLGNRPAVIDFYAEWCGPCKMIAPHLENLSEVYKGQVDFYQIDVDEQEELAAFFNIQAMPTIIFIAMDGDMQSVVGARSEDEYKMMIQEYILR